MKIDIDDHICDNKIFEGIFNQNYKLVRNYLNYRFKNYETSEDCAQSAFLLLWENCAKIKPVQAKKFLVTTSYRLVLNQYRKEKVEKSYKENHKQEAFDGFSPDLIYDETALNTKIYNAIEELPEKQKIVFMMNRFENQTYKDIAELLGLSVKAVEKRMHFALLSLKESLK